MENVLSSCQNQNAAVNVAENINNKLPVEMLAKIFTHLPSVGDSVNASLTCTLWKDILEKPIKEINSLVERALQSEMILNKTVKVYNLGEFCSTILGKGEGMDLSWRHSVDEYLSLSHDEKINFMRNIIIEFNQSHPVKTLDLSNCILTSLPPEIGLLTQLENLNLKKDQLSFLPPEIYDLKQLQTLSVEGNLLNDEDLVNDEDRAKCAKFKKEEN